MLMIWRVKFLFQRAGITAAAVLVAAAGGCTVVTPPLDGAARQRGAADAQRQLFEGQEPIGRPLRLAEATARAIKYQAEHRQRRMEEAAAAAQLDVAQFDLLPKLTASAGYSTRNNEAFGFGFTPDGTIATTPSASVERTRSSASIGLTWNVLDFGVAYYRARQLSDQKLIARERRRKAVQTLLHDVRVAWWRAEAAERLLPAADRLLVEVDQAIEKTRFIEARKVLPPVQTATLRRALLDLSQQIASRRSDLAQARIELAVLINVAPGAELRVATIDRDLRPVPDLSADIEKLEALALQMRPEMAEEGYRARISADEARKALIGLLPGVSLDFGLNHDSNRFLLHNTWTSAGVNVALNLVKVFSLPALNRLEAAQRDADQARRLAMAMAVLAQTRLAAVRYALVADEFLIWDEAARDDELIVKYLAAGEKVGIDTEIELIRARARAMASQINRDLAYANVQASIARVFNSVGYDAVPQEDETKAVAVLSDLIEMRFGELERASFSPRAPIARPSVVLEQIRGASPRVASLLREGAQRVLAAARMQATGGPVDVELQMQLYLDTVDQGRRAARVAIVARPGPAGTTLTREFRTSLSEPVDDEQWRVVGEGAVYRIVGEIAAVRITRPTLRAAESLTTPLQPPGGPDTRWLPLLQLGRPIDLRLDRALELEAPAASGAGKR